MEGSSDFSFSPFSLLLSSFFENLAKISDDPF